METEVTQSQVQTVESADQRGGCMKVYCLSRVGLLVFEVKSGGFFRLSWTLKASSDHRMALLRADGNDQRMVKLDFVANVLVKVIQ